jgi:hypothetical protein
MESMDELLGDSDVESLLKVSSSSMLRLPHAEIDSDSESAEAFHVCYECCGTDFCEFCSPKRISMISYYIKRNL